jgi:hypothetical protein
MNSIIKLIISLLAIIGLGVFAFVALVMIGDTGPSTKQFIDSSREIFQLEKSKEIDSESSSIQQHDISKKVVTAPPIRRPIETVNIPSHQDVIQSGYVTTTETGKVTKLSVDERREKLAKLKTIQANLEAATKQNPAELDIALVDKALVELITIGGDSGLVGGVKIQELRENLKVASEMAALGKEIEAYSSNPVGTDPVKMREYVKKLQELQSMLVNPTVYTPEQEKGLIQVHE